MENLEQEEKVAILLNAMGEDAIAPALSKVDGEKAEDIRNRLEAFRDNPPSVQLVESVLEDFERFFKFALDAANAESYWTKFVKAHQEEEEEELAASGSATTYNGDGTLDESEEGEQEEEPPIQKFKLFKPSEDEMLDLKRLHPLQIAEALKGERPKTMAIVLRALDKKQNAAVIENLPEEFHGDLIHLLVGDEQTPAELQRRIVRTVVQKALTIEAPQASEPDAIQQTVAVLRELPRDLRNNMMEHLRTTDTEKANLIQKEVFQFEDISRYDDSSIQKILAEVDKGQLVIGLQSAPDAAKECVTRNLSKRARESLEEELELLGKQTVDVVNEAQNAIASVIAKLDQDNQLDYI